MKKHVLLTILALNACAFAGAPVQPQAKLPQAAEQTEAKEGDVIAMGEEELEEDLEEQNETVRS